MKKWIALKEQGDIKVQTDDAEYALVIHHVAGLSIGLDEEEAEHLLRVLETLLVERQPPNLDGYALAVPSPNNEWHFYHIDCTVRVPKGVHALNVCPHELSLRTVCAKCGGNIHKAALRDA